MPSFSKVNLIDDVEAVGRGDVEGRMARKHLDSDQLGVSLFRYGANAKGPYGHRHKEQEEAYLVISGSGQMKLDDEIVELRQWDVVRVAPEVTRAIAAGPDGIELVCVGGTRPPEGDGEFVQDFWV